MRNPTCILGKRAKKDQLRLESEDVHARTLPILDTQDIKGSQGS